MITQLYKSVRGSLPPRYKSILSKIVFRFSSKPFVKYDNIDPLKKFPGGEQGGLIISADFEMSWAFRYSKKNMNYIELGKLERENVPLLINLFDKHHVPVTWATVGHLFLSECKQGDHDWMCRIPHFDDHWRFIEGDWFQHDPYTDYTTNGEWYAPDLIRMILDSPVKHEIGCHTFSHIDCTYENCPPKVLYDELTASRMAAEKFGLKLTSFVFPGGTAGNFEILKNNGYRIYRKNIDVDLAYPFYDNFGLLVTPTSSSIGDNGMGWSKNYFIYRYKKYLQKAIKSNTIAHFWFHPSMDKWTLHEILPEVLSYACAMRESGKLWIGTMGEIADHISSANNI